ncbi:MAG: exopolyphosphatase [Streptosporangiaceae bacterium]
MTSTATRVATVDCGTNSVRLLVADVDASVGRLADVERRMEITRLGQGVDSTGRLAPEALDRTLRVLGDYAHAVGAHGAEKARVAATSATRDADNRADFVDGVIDILGVRPEVLTGEEEAALSYVGATRELAGMVDLPPPHLVVDIGGGSTEYVLGDGEARAARSVDVGSVRLTERHLHDDPPTALQASAAADDVDRALDLVSDTVSLVEARSLIGLAGTVTTVAGIALGLSSYDPERIHHSRLSAADVHDVTERLLGMSREERAAMPVIHPGRVDVIAAGALVLSRTIRRLGLPELLVSEHDILDGLAWSLV